MEKICEITKIIHETIKQPWGTTPTAFQLLDQPSNIQIILDYIYNKST